MLKQTRLSFSKLFRDRFQMWVRRRIPAADQVDLNHGNIFILPSRQGLGFFVMLALMFVGAINYESSLAFALVFLLISLFLLTILYTFRNLSGLSLSATDHDSVFAGSMATVVISLERNSGRMYEAVHVSYKAGTPETADLLENNQQSLPLQVNASRRGMLSPGRLLVESTFPFGLVRAWSSIDLNIQCLVYPRPITCDLDWLLSSNADSGNLNLQTGNDDFHGLRDYRPGDSLRHIAWKQYARGRGLYTKEYSSNVDERIWLTWDMFADMNTEERLSRLCYCVLELDVRNIDYGLRLPQIELAPSKGAAHYAKVLKTLALFRLDEATDVVNTIDDNGGEE